MEYFLTSIVVDGWCVAMVDCASKSFAGFLWTDKNESEMTWWTYTWPNSWAIVNAADNPLSWTMAHDDCRHIVPNSANPNVSHFIWLVLRQICSLQIEKNAIVNKLTLQSIVSHSYLVSNRAVSCGNCVCCTNLQNRDNICDADTPIRAEKKTFLCFCRVNLSPLRIDNVIMINEVHLSNIEY